MVSACHRTRPPSLAEPHAFTQVDGPLLRLPSEGRTVPPDDEEVLGRPEASAVAPPAPGPAGRLRRLLHEVRPHRALGRRTPAQAFAARTKARPTQRGIDVDGYRVRHDKVDTSGTVTLRYRSRLHHVGIGRRYKGTQVLLLTAGRQVRITA